MDNTDLVRVLERLYASEINVSVSSFWDGGWDVKLGDEMNGWKAEATFHPSNGTSPDTFEHARGWLTLTDAAAWLDREARIHFPESTYARTAYCCKIGCPADAEYEVVTVRAAAIAGPGVETLSAVDRMAGPDPYSDYTHACADHVGELLGHQPDAPRPESARRRVQIDSVLDRYSVPA